MSYTIKHADGTPVVIQDSDINKDYYSANQVGVQLVGRNVIDYGAPTAQNFLQMLENFASDSFPTWPSTTPVGMIFFNTTDKQLYLKTKTTAPVEKDNWAQLFVVAPPGQPSTIPGNVIITGNLTLGGTLTVPVGLFGDGTVVAPSISFINDSDTGFYKANSGDNAVQFSSGGTQKLSFSSKGLISFGVVDSAKGASFASAATIQLGTATGNYVDVTGTTTIVSLGTNTAGTIRYVKFTGVLTLTHNATSLKLPGNVNITTAVGDVAVFVGEGASNWTCVSYSQGVGNSTMPTGGGTDKVFFINDNVVTANYTIPANKNAMTAGPITINSGIVVTISNGSVWAIV